MRLRKEFGRTVAVQGLTLEVPRGEVFGFLGPNGAGKTTSIKMLLSLVAPTSGEAQTPRTADFGPQASGAGWAFFRSTFGFTIG